MARPIKEGLDYFPLDVSLEDDVELLEAECGLEGFAILIKLYQKIYKNSFYIKWEEDNALLFSRKVNTELTKVNDVIKVCFKRDLFSKSLYESHKILTSCGIQKRFFKIYNDARRKGLKVNDDYLLVNAELTGDNVIINTSPDRIDDESSTQSKGEYSKGEDIKKDKTKKENEDDLYIESFEELWSIYPVKKGKGSISNSKTKLKRIHNDKEELKRCIDRYKEYVEYRRNNGFKSLNYMNGSTFFNTGYIDYLDDNYQDIEEIRETKIQKPKSFDELDVVEGY